MLTMDHPLPEVAEVSRQLVAAIEVTMNPYADQQRRLSAYEACESFKESSPLCAQCGLYLARKENPHIIRHFGLQLMEHCIKYKWNSISQREKIFIKENAMRLLEVGTEPLLQEQAHIKDALSRIVVEMIKREWPQQWPGLLQELNALCQLGESQTELVLLVFLRLVEDVAVLQTLESNQRRKDICQALTGSMGEIFAFFISLIETRCERFWESLAAGEARAQEAAAHARVVQVVLLTLTGFVEWVSINHIMAQDGKLLQILCALLDKENFQSDAAECLLQIVNRKGRAEERKPLLILFNDLQMTCIFQACVTACAKPFNEPRYVFLKRMTQVLTGLGTQLCTLWAKETSGPMILPPPNFSIYLESMITFTKHHSLVLAHLVNSLWASFLRHEMISRDPTFLSFVPRWVEATAPRVIKSGFPSKMDSPCSAWSSMEFDSDEEFATFFHRCRTDFLDAFRHATVVAPLVCFSFVENWLTTRLQRSVEQRGEPCTGTSLEYLEWDALSQVLDSVLGKILATDRGRPPVESGLRLLEMCLAFETDDPLVLSTLLSCISALFVFLSMAPGSGLLPRVLDKIFAALILSPPGQTKESRSRAVRNVRRHAASLMVKIAHKYPLLLLPAFEHIATTVEGLGRDPGQLSKLERLTLQEALLLVSNHFWDYGRQSAFIASVIRPAAEQWLAVADAFHSPLSFMTFVGLDRPPVEPSSDDLNGQNRAHLIYCVSLILAVVKRSARPEDDPDRARRGGFVAPGEEGTGATVRSPAAPHVLPLLPPVLSLLAAFNAMWRPEVKARLSEGYANAHSMLEVDKANLLGGSGCPLYSQGGILPPSSPDDSLDPASPRTYRQTPLDRMQHFLSSVHDQSYHILGAAGPSLGRDLYRMPNLASSLISTVFSNLEVIPDYRLRPISRVFLKPFVCACPSAAHEDVLLPILAHFCPYMFYRLSEKWQYITQLYESGGIDNENTDTQEVLDDMLNRQLTREYLDVLKIVLIGYNGNMAGISDGLGAGGTESMEQDDPGWGKGGGGRGGCSAGNPMATLQNELLSDLGQLVLRNEATRRAVTLVILRALSWQDTIVSLKATFLAGPLIRQLVGDGSLDNEWAAHTMASVLGGLQAHGHHETNQSFLLALGVMVYELLRPAFPDAIFQVMNQIPNLNMEELQKLDEKLSVPSRNGAKMDKIKKEKFKRLTSQLIGRNLSQLFKKEVSIKNLPPMHIRKRKRPNPVLDDVSNESAIVKSSSHS
ncbi:exportin-5 isoform X3 [Ischnura elegans]|uniref:exportin-5 isoform X3 n=1 Tax=Ischnura elegans TaxID=197161 RepID=UPI001ED87C94|nr:exportin-5 isoform X3 [Ischnura elegans]XP_046395856.1 exportin-5 isoform X3 [Ischnura elegans]